MSCDNYTSNVTDASNVTITAQGEQGGEVSMSCKAAAAPEPSYTWKKIVTDDKNVTKDEDLRADLVKVNIL